MMVLVNFAVSQDVTADFTFTQDCETVSFENLSTESGGASITGYEWDFGDNNTSTEEDPVHVYGNEGDYEVILKVIHDAGDDVQVQYTVSVWYPSANFLATSVCFGLATEFTSTSLSPNSSIDIWEWDFDNDGIYETTGNPVSFTFDLTGPIMIGHRVTNEYGCQAETQKNIVVKEPPIASFSADPVCYGTETEFVNGSTTPVGNLSDHRWDFDNDGEFDSFDENPVYTFPTAGIFPVTLEVENNQNCTHTYTTDIEVFANPIASYAVDPGCPLEESVFSDESTGAATIVNWEWDFDDGSPLLNVQSPSHIFYTNGEYNVILIIEDENGCQDDTANIVIQQKPDAGFEAEQVCQGFITVFDDTSIYETGYPIESWEWDFADGFTSTEEDPEHLYASHGLYEVELIVTNGLLCKDTALNSVVVDTLPIAAFTYDPACKGLPSCFYDESIPNADTIIAWEWDFGDGSGSTLKDPCHIYFSGGNYDVTLTVTNSNGCVSEVYMETIYVSIAPDVDFNFNQICFGDTTFFENLTDTFGYQISFLQWHFGDTASVDSISSEFNPSHLFSFPGDYDVKLIVENEYGCIDSATYMVTVDSIPEANFIMQDTISVGVMFGITDQSVAHGSPIFTWVWEFGDGTSGTNINPINHTYYETGEYIVCLTVTDWNGCMHQHCDTITVIDRPVADFSFASDVTLETFFFDQSQPESDLINWYWEFGDPITTEDTASGTPTPMWQYPSEGWFTVYLEVTDKFGGTHDTTKIIYAGNAIKAEYATFGQCVGDTTSFIDLSSSELTASFDNWYWDFGDGNDTTLYVQTDTIIHFYEFPGNYLVRFAVSDTINGFFMSDTAVNVVSIFESPVAKIDTAGLDVCFGTTIDFHDATAAMLDPIEGWIWDFDTPQGDSAFIKNPSWLYADTGAYNVKLTVFTEKGCSDTDSIFAHVNYTPEFGFFTNNNCVNSPTYFIPNYDSSVLTITKWEWDFGDSQSSSNTSTLARPTHVYDRVDEYLVTMKMEAYSCPGEVQQPMLVYPIPYSQFTYTENYGGVQGRTQFTNNSIYAYTYLWDFGNGNTSNVPEPVEVYEFDSTYLVTLISYNEYFCSDTSWADVSVFFRGLYFPTAFSPNNPNDEVSHFTPKGVNMKEYLVQVFDSQGNLMWESDKLDENGTPVESWDGYHNGLLMPQDMYIWKAAGKFTDGSVWQGQSFDGGTPKTNGVVTLVR